MWSHTSDSQAASTNTPVVEEMQEGSVEVVVKGGDVESSAAIAASFPDGTLWGWLAVLAVRLLSTRCT